MSTGLASSRTPPATPRAAPAAPVTPSATPSRSAGALRLVWPVALLALGATVTAAPWQRWTVTLVFVGVAVLPVLLLAGFVRAGVPRFVASALLTLLLVMVAYLLSAGARLSLVQTVRDSVPRLLTAPQPYLPHADVLVGPILLVGLVSLLVGLRSVSGVTGVAGAAGVTGVGSVVRSGDAARVAPVLGAAVLYLVGFLLSDGAADPWGLAAVLLFVVAVLGWVFLDEHSEPPRLRIAVAVPVALAGVLVLALSATLPTSGGFSPRSLVTPPTVDVATTNPMAQLSAWAVNDDAPLLLVRGDAVPLRLATLDTYDGQQWSASTSYAYVDTDGRTGLVPAPETRTATVEVGFDGLGGNWLPSPGLPTAVGAPDALVDPATGTLLTTGPTTGLVYQVVGTYPDAPAARLRTAGVPTDAAAQRYLHLPEVPADVASYARRVVAGVTNPYERALRIADQLRHDYRFKAASVAGSALYRLQSFLFGRTDTPGGKVGTSEQFAAAFGVIARYDGLPTRVVVGFGPGQDQGDGTRLITAGDGLAWDEVYFTGIGWVPFSPTRDDATFPHDDADPTGLADPGASSSPTPSAAPSAPASASPAPTPSPDPAGVAVASGNGSGTPGTADGGRWPTWLPRLLVGLLALLIVVLVVVGLWVARAVRRWRHRRRGAAGAWLEVLDGLRLAGMSPGAHQSAGEVAEQTDARLRSPATRRVAAAAERARFSPEGTAGSEPGPVFAQVRVVHRGLRATLPWWRRWAWWLDPRVLLPRRDPRPGRLAAEAVTQGVRGR